MCGVIQIIWLYSFCIILRFFFMPSHTHTHTHLDWNETYNKSWKKLLNNCLTLFKNFYFHCVSVCVYVVCQNTDLICGKWKSVYLLIKSWNENSNCNKCKINLNTMLCIIKKSDAFVYKCNDDGQLNLKINIKAFFSFRNARVSPMS